jgi:ATP-dependent protease ClpP protease subunit
MPRTFESAARVFALAGDRTGRKSWFNISNKDTGPSVIHIYDEIGMFGISAGDFIKDLNATSGAIELHLGTPGGEIWDGISIYNALRSKGNVAVFVDSIAASIGSVIAQAADPGKLYIESTGRMMIHDGYAMAAGNAAELGRMVEQLNSASDTIAGIYASRSGKPAADWRKAMLDETWYGAQESVDAGLADAVVNGGVLQNGSRASALMNAASVPYVGSTQTRHEPTTVTHSHDHAAMGADDADDGIHSHSHTHDGDSMHDHSHDGTEGADTDQDDWDSVYAALRGARPMAGDDGDLSELFSRFHKSNNTL